MKFRRIFQMCPQCYGSGSVIKWPPGSGSVSVNSELKILITTVPGTYLTASISFNGYKMYGQDPYPAGSVIN